MNAELDIDARAKLAIYRHFADSGRAPTPQDMARAIGCDEHDVVAAYARLRAQRVLALEKDGRSIRMAPPFSGIPTEHEVLVDGMRSFANCAWDSLGILAALQRPGDVRSRCGQSQEPLHLHVERDGPEQCDWLFHCLVPAAKWWDDIVFT
ncbi:MAG TPA: organomercurial lyase [Gemmatimonadaceae bacterium]|nr:organomercurial lyase [Gemmatimonadaceae bacterium]